MKATYETGLRGEAEAERYLTGKGMKCLDRRYRACGGEIDLIMAEHDIIVFVEVKYRPEGAAGSGLMAIDRNKCRRLSRAAFAYLTKNGLNGHPARFDVVEISRGGILHIPNAFPAVS